MRTYSLTDALGKVWVGWKRVAHAIGNVQARILLSVFYFTVVPPFALVLKSLADPLALRKSDTGTFWLERLAPKRPTDGGRRQY